MTVIDHCQLTCTKTESRKAKSRHWFAKGTFIKRSKGSCKRTKGCFSRPHYTVVNTQLCGLKYHDNLKVDTSAKVALSTANGPLYLNILPQGL